MFRTVHFYIYHISCQEREEDKQYLLQTLCCSSILILACYYPCVVKHDVWVVTGIRKDGIAAKHWYKLIFVNESGFYAF